MKKSLIFWFAAATCAAWILVGCESPTNGESGAAGAPGTIYLSGAQTTAGIQDAIDSGAPLVFAGVAQYDNGTVTIPAGRGVKLVGDDAYTVADNAAAFLILGDASSVTGTGGIDAQSNGNVIGPQAVLDASVTGGNKLVYQTIGTGGELTFTGGKAAVNGNVTIGAAGAAGTITPTTLAGNTLYVVGDLTVGVALTGTATLNVLGDATVGTADQTQAVVWNVKGTLTANKAPTIASGSVTANTLDVSQAGAAISLLGTVDVETLKTVGTVVITTDTATGLEADTVTGAATFAASAKIASADFADAATFATGADIGSASFGGAVTFSGTATLGTVTFGGDVTTTVSSALTLTEDEPVTLAATKSIKVGSDIVLTAGAAGAVLTPGDGTTLTPAAKQLTLDAANLTLTSGALTVAAGAELAITSVSLTVEAANATLALTGAASNGAKLTGTGKVVLGNANIIGSTHGWQAVGADTSIAFSNSAAAAVAITGTGTTPKLVAAGATVGAITLGAQGSSNAALTVTNAEIDLTTGGSILITYHSTESTIVLKGGTATLGKLTLNSANETTNVTSSHYAKVGTNKAVVSGTGIVVKGSADSNGANAGSIAGGTTAGDNDATITGLTATSDVTLKNDSTFADT